MFIVISFIILVPIKRPYSDRSHAMIILMIMKVIVRKKEGYTKTAYKEDNLKNIPKWVRRTISKNNNLYIMS